MGVGSAGLLAEREAAEPATERSVDVERLVMMVFVRTKDPEAVDRVRPDFVESLCDPNLCDHLYLRGHPFRSVPGTRDHVDQELCRRVDAARDGQHRRRGRVVCAWAAWRWTLNRGYRQVVMEARSMMAIENERVFSV
jgi:hypothetical protein